MIGKTISHYRILDKLGEGGMGVVYKAEDTELKRAVALKFLSKQALGGEEEKSRFVHEAQSAAALDHPGICTVHEISKSEEHTFIAMAYVEGQSLKEKIESGPFKLDEAVDIAIRVAEGLQEAHEKGIVHRDIKPGNIMVTPKGQAKIMDFGLAKAPGRTKLTKTGMTLGTAAYMSPEQARGGEIDSRTDIWSLGAVIYEMVTGQGPFKGDYEQAVMYSILNEPPEPVTALRTGVPMDLERIVNKALAKRPDERYQHMGEILVDLRLVRKKLEPGAVKLRPIERGRPLGKRFLLYGGIVVVLAVVLVGRTYLFPAKSEPIDSIAVLPLENLSGDPDEDYFADGMTDELITNLAQIGALRVISRTSAMRYKGSDKSLPEIAQELKVRAIVEGSVMRVGDRVRITAQLIEVAGDRHLWAESYERDLSDVLVLQSEVARTIAGEVRVTITPEEEARLASTRSVNPEAHERYVKGRHYCDKWTKEGFEKAIEYFQQAIDIDSSYAQAYVGLADSYLWLRFLGVLTTEEALSRANPLLRKALEIDDDLAEAHGTLAGNKHYIDWDFAGAEEEYKRSIKLNPNLVDTRLEYGLLLVVMGRLEEAIAEAKLAVQLDPLSGPAIRSLAGVYLNARQYDQAIAQFRQLAELQPDNPAAYMGFERVYLVMGNYEDAVSSRQKAMTLSGARPEEIEALDRAYTESGPRGYWTWQLERLKGRYDRNPVLAARIYAELGDKDEAFVWLEKAYEKRSASMFTLTASPEWDLLRDDPRYEDLVRRMNSPG